MRRLAFAALLLAIAMAPARLLASGDVLGASGEVYRVQSGAYQSLFADAPAGSELNQVLALDIVRDGKTQRLLVPGTDGPGADQTPALAVDHTTNTVYLVWQAQHNIHSVLDLVGYSTDDGFGDVFEFSGDAFSTKFNPQLATTIDHYQTLADDGTVAQANRAILHLVWSDDGSYGRRNLYTPLVIEDGALLRTNVIFDLAELADQTAGATGATAPASLEQKPQIRTGRDGQSVAIAFVTPGSERLSALELRSVTGELVSFADKARAQVIEIGRANPGLSRSSIAEKARAQVIEIGRKLMGADVSDYLAKSFTDAVGASSPTDDLEIAAEKARAQVIEIGASLRRGAADKARAQVIEIGRTVGGPTHLLDLRKAAARDLPTLPDRAMRVFLSPRGDDAAVAWSVDNTVRYRETTDAGWGPVRVLTLSPTLSANDAYDLVAQRLAAR
jgi:hypothetical protein